MEKKPSFPDTFQELNVLSDFEHAKGLIAERARQLFGQLFEKGRREEPPFMPEELVQLLDIQKIIKTDLGRTSAMLLKSYNGYIIKLNQYHNEARKNFSFAHEIGHILFNELNLDKYIQNIEYRTFNPQREQHNRALLKERLCDIAATEILMPESIFKTYLSNYNVSVQTVEQLASLFGVSIQSTAIRIAETSNQPCLAILWRPWPTNKPKGLRLVWRTGQRVKQQNRTNYIPIHKLVKPPSLLHEALESCSSIESFRSFKINNAVERLRIESKGFGNGENRYVISLAFLN